MLATSTAIDLNQKSQALGDCLKSVNSIGSTIYRNICTGQQAVVPWGSGDWIGNVIITLIGLVLVSALTAMLIDVLRN